MLLQWLLLGARVVFFCNAVDDVLTEFYPSPLEEGRSPGARRSARFRVTCCVIEINHLWTLRASATDIFINPPPPGRQRTNEKQRSAHTMDIITLLKLLSTRTPGWHRASGGFEGQAWEDYSCKAHPCQRERERKFIDVQPIERIGNTWRRKIRLWPSSQTNLSPGLVWMKTVESDFECRMMPWWDFWPCGHDSQPEHGPDL